MAHIYKTIMVLVVFTIMANNCMASRSAGRDVRMDVLLTKLRSAFRKRDDTATCELSDDKYLSPADIANLPASDRADYIKTMLDSAETIRNGFNDAGANLSNDRELVDFLYKNLSEDKDQLSSDDYESLCMVAKNLDAVLTYNDQQNSDQSAKRIQMARRVAMNSFRE